MRRPGLTVAILLALFCSRREEIGTHWLIEQPRTILVDSGQPPKTLYRRTSNGKLRVDELILTWRDYGRCIVYVTARSGNSTFVSCDERAPALVGIDWDALDSGLVQDANGTRRALSSASLVELTRDRPPLSEDWAKTMSEDDERRMLENVERLSKKPTSAIPVSQNGPPGSEATTP